GVLQGAARARRAGGARRLRRAHAGGAGQRRAGDDRPRPRADVVAAVLPRARRDRPFGLRAATLPAPHFSGLEGGPAGPFFVRSEAGTWRRRTRRKGNWSGRSR